VFLIFLALFPTFVFSHSKQSDIDKVVSLISEDLKEQGIKTIKEIYSKTNKKNVLAVTKHFSKFKLAQSNKLNNDTLYYAVEEDSLSFDIDEVYIHKFMFDKKNLKEYFRNSKNPYSISLFSIVTEICFIDNDDLKDKNPFGVLKEIRKKLEHNFLFISENDTVNSNLNTFKGFDFIPLKNFEKHTLN